MEQIFSHKTLRKMIFILMINLSNLHANDLSLTAMTHEQGKIVQAEFDYYPEKYFFVYGNGGVFLKDNTFEADPALITEGGVGLSVIGGPVFVAVKQGLSWQSEPFYAILFGEKCPKSKFQVPTSVLIGITDKKITIAAILEHYSNGFKTPTNTSVNFYGLRFIYSL